MDSELWRTDEEIDPVLRLRRIRQLTRAIWRFEDRLALGEGLHRSDGYYGEMTEERLQSLESMRQFYVNVLHYLRHCEAFHINSNMETHHV